MLRPRVHIMSLWWNQWETAATTGNCIRLQAFNTLKWVLSLHEFKARVSEYFSLPPQPHLISAKFVLYVKNSIVITVSPPISCTCGWVRAVQLPVQQESVLTERPTNHRRRPNRGRQNQTRAQPHRVARPGQPDPPQLGLHGRGT